MKNILSHTKTAIVLLLVIMLSLGFYVYMLSRSNSYGTSYHNEIVYEGVAFEGTLKFYPDGTLTNKSTNFDEIMKGYYYYKDGYVTTYTCTSAIIFAIAGGIVALTLIVITVSLLFFAKRRKVRNKIECQVE